MRKVGRAHVRDARERTPTNLTTPGNFMWQEDRYREVLRTPQKSDLLVKIWRDAFAEEYPDDADPFGFVTISDLNRFAEALKLREGERLLDVGCGRGGPGLWVARKTGAALIGMDILPEAVAQADALRERLGVPVERAEFAVGSFTKTNLPDASVEAIMSVDAFWMVLDKIAALKEMARVVRSRGRFVLTTWVPPYLDMDAMLGAAGFRLLTCEEPQGWKERQMAVYSAILNNRSELPSAIGDRAAEILIAEAEEAPARLSSAPRRYVVGERFE